MTLVLPHAVFPPRALQIAGPRQETHPRRSSGIVAGLDEYLVADVLKIHKTIRRRSRFRQTMLVKLALRFSPAVIQFRTSSLAQTVNAYQELSIVAIEVTSVVQVDPLRSSK